VTNNDKYQLAIHERITDVPIADWNALLPAHAGPFLRHEFLSAPEETSCVGDNTGWQIAHLTLKSNEQLIGAMPLYLKQHSYGEFVFDWSWAQAYQQNGLSYYPKALCAIPFTPAQGPRLLCSPSVNQTEVTSVLIEALKTLIAENNLSSAHILFPQLSESETLKAHGFLLRDSVQFHWHNQAFQNFEHFLFVLTMKRRKNIRREREQVFREGVSFRHVPGKESTFSRLGFLLCLLSTYLSRTSLKPLLK
jgi:predicted N-acyltransferase